MVKMHGIISLLALGIVLTISSPAVLAKNSYTLDGKPISEATYRAIKLAEEGRNLLIAGNYDEAIEKLHKSENLDDSFAEVQTNLGLALSKTGRPSLAIKHLERAIKMDPSDSAAWLNLASSYQATGFLPKAVDMYQRYLQRFPDDSNHSQIQALYNDLNKELRDQSKAAANEVIATSDDYFKYTIARDGVVHWDLSRMPLKVFVHNSDGTRLYSHRFDSLLREAFAEWSDSSSGQVSFKYTDDESHADITVRWTDDASVLSSQSEGGEARVQFGMSGLNRCNIFLLTTHDGASSKMLTDSAVRSLCLHEVGHALGLMGHSPDAGDIMYCSMPEADERQHVTARDRNTLIRVYQSKVELASELMQTPDVQRVKLNNEGVDAITANNLEKAVELFEASLKVDPTYETARANLGGACNNLAIELMQSGDKVRAEKLFRRALECHNNDASHLKLTLENLALLLHDAKRDSEAIQYENQAKALEPTRVADKR